MRWRNHSWAAAVPAADRNSHSSIGFFGTSASRLIATEMRGKGMNVMLGPGVNLARVPTGGRNFEYISGEDPVLGATLAVPLLLGQQNHVMAIGKHFMLNNQETDRSGVNEVVDEKTMMELYWPAFEAMAKNNVSGFMCAYNRINGHYACENNHTLNTMLREDAGFTGFVVSDWGATHSTSRTTPHASRPLDSRQESTPRRTRHPHARAREQGPVARGQAAGGAGSRLPQPERRRYVCGFAFDRSVPFGERSHRLR